jgi:hypothetical protein
LGSSAIHWASFAEFGLPKVAQLTASSNEHVSGLSISLPGGTARPPVSQAVAALPADPSHCDTEAWSAGCESARIRVEDLLVRVSLAGHVCRLLSCYSGTTDTSLSQLSRGAVFGFGSLFERWIAQARVAYCLSKNSSRDMALISARNNTMMVAAGSPKPRIEQLVAQSPRNTTEPP